MRLPSAFIRTWCKAHDAAEILIFHTILHRQNHWRAANHVIHLTLSTVHAIR